MTGRRATDLLQQAKTALTNGDHEGAYRHAERALNVLVGRSSGNRRQEHACRHLMAQCLEATGDRDGALRLHKENASRGSELPDTYQRLAFLGERLGDLEAVRAGSGWLQDFAGEFGLIDKREQSRLARVEKRAARGAFGPSASQASEPAGAAPGAQTGCAAVALLALLGATLAVLLQL